MSRPQLASRRPLGTRLRVVSTAACLALLSAVSVRADDPCAGVDGRAPWEKYHFVSPAPLAPAGRDPALERLIAARVPRGASVWTESKVVKSLPPVVVVHFSNMGTVDQASAWQRAAIVERDPAGGLTWDLVKDPRDKSALDVGYLDGAYGLPKEPALIFLRVRKGRCEVYHVVKTDWAGWKATPWDGPLPTAPAGPSGSPLASATTGLPSAGPPPPAPPARLVASPTPAVREKPVTVTVPGWIGPEHGATHLRSRARLVALPLQEDYLLPHFKSAAGLREDLWGFRWSGAVGDTRTHTHLLGPDPPGAAPELTSQLLGHMAEAYIRAQRSRALVSLNVEAHSWGGVLAYLALKALERDVRFQRYARGGVEVNLDTFGSPVGCLDRDTLERHAQRIEQSALADALDLSDVPEAAAFRAAFDLGGVSLQPVSLGRLVSWRNYRIEADLVACDVSSLPPDRRFVLPGVKGAGSSHSQYYTVPDNVRQIVANRTPKVSLLPVAGDQQPGRDR